MTKLQVQALLRDHARTFALTLWLLPGALREPLGVAYLLARASDTVADAGNLPRGERLQILGELEAALRADNPLVWKAKIPSRALSCRENELIAAVPRLLGRLEMLSDREELLRLWSTILRGQIFDLRRFTPGSDPLSRNELERYCHFVAGSVGESWTRLIGRHVSGVLMRPVGEMIPLGASYGKGLQLLNILRDREFDRDIGRIYAREEDLMELLKLAVEWLGEGEKYLEHLRPGRVLHATSLPLDLALRTLEEIRRSPDATRIKVSRRMVYSMLLANLLSLWLPRRANPAS